MTDFNLSEKIEEESIDIVEDYLLKDDVKEFIKRLKEKLCLDQGNGICEGLYGGDNLCNNCREINNLAGEKLI